MKTLKIKDTTHKRLCTFKAILGAKSIDRVINVLIDCARENEYEYGDLTINEYEALANYDK